MSSNQFSVDEWNVTECRLTIVVLDLSNSTTFPINTTYGCSTVLSYAKDYIIALAPTLTKGRLVVVACASRCEVPECKARSPFCQCEDSHNTRVVFHSDKACDPNDLVRVIAPLEANGQTYIAAPIAALPTVALEEVELQQRRACHRQAIAFLMGRHSRLGQSSQVHRLPLDMAAEILKWLGPSTVHARVIMAIDGDNNASCGRPECEACSKGKERECWLDGQQGLARAVKGLLSASGAASTSVRLLNAPITDSWWYQGEFGNECYYDWRWGTRANKRTRGALCSHSNSYRVYAWTNCARAGGRYEAIKEDDKNFIAESFKFYDKLTQQPKLHVQARVQAVKGFMDMVKANKVLDVGVRTRFTGRDKDTWKALVKIDKKRQKLCERIHGEACTHGEDRNLCLRSCKQKLMSPQPFASQDTHRNLHKLTKELLDSSLFIAKNFEMVGDSYSTLNTTGPAQQLPPLQRLAPLQRLRPMWPTTVHTMPMPAPSRIRAVPCRLRVNTTRAMPMAIGVLIPTP